MDGSYTLESAKSDISILGRDVSEIKSGQDRMWKALEKVADTSADMKDVLARIEARGEDAAKVLSSVAEIAKTVDGHGYRISAVESSLKSHKDNPEADCPYVQDMTLVKANLKLVNWLGAAFGSAVVIQSVAWVFSLMKGVK